MYLSIKRLLPVLLLLLVVSGCASNDIYRKEFSNCVASPQQSCEDHSIQLHHAKTEQEYLLGFVEIDDQGQLRNRKQMQAVLDQLYTMAANESLLINVFVHGWHHNAKPQDPNVESFKVSLVQLSQLENRLAAAQNKQPRKVVGVYIGWRGESIDVPLLNNITFWDRKSTAQEVGHLGMDELLLKLEEISNVKNTLDPPIKSRLVIVGHSFGGAAVYSATSQILASRFVDSRENKNFNDTAKGFGDLVVLLNPAFEALSYAPLYDLAQARCSYFPEQPPRLVILTSEADKATKYLFPMGRFFSSFFEAHQSVNRDDCRRPLNYHEGAADRSTVGHFKPLLTHELRPASQAKKAVYAEAVNVWRQQEAGGVQQYGATELLHLNKSALRNPFLNVKVDKRLIEDHNDVFGEEIQEFLRQLVVISTQE